MKDKIIEIQEKYDRRANFAALPRRYYHGEVAGEILALQFTEAQNLYFWKSNILRFLGPAEIKNLYEWLEKYVPLNGSEKQERRPEDEE